MPLTRKLEVQMRRIDHSTRLLRIEIFQARQMSMRLRYLMRVPWWYRGKLEDWIVEL